MDVNFDKGNRYILFYNILVQYTIYFLNARKEHSSYSPSNRSIWNNCLQHGIVTIHKAVTNLRENFGYKAYSTSLQSNGKILLRKH